jgi:cell shape-determining protein MreC
MSFRFNQVFLGLLALAAVSAFVLPVDLTNRLRGFQSIFAPVARPTRAVAGALNDRFRHEQPRDTRDVETVKLENEELRVALMSISGQLEELKRVANDLDRLGDVRQNCTRFKVIGPSTDTRDSLLLTAASRENVEENMPVLSGRGLVGVIERVGQAGAQVRLITDRDFKVSGRFVRVTSNAGHAAEVALATKIPLVRGAGNGLMEIANIELKETALTDDPEKAKVAVGDYVKLEDPLWPPNLAGRVLGQVESITQQAGAPQHAMIRIRPLLDLLTLREVMVMNKLDLPQQQPPQTASEKTSAKSE